MLKMTNPSYWFPMFLQFVHDSCCFLNSYPLLSNDGQVPNQEGMSLENFLKPERLLQLSVCFLTFSTDSAVTVSLAYSAYLTTLLLLLDFVSGYCACPSGPLLFRVTQGQLTAA